MMGLERVNRRMHQLEEHKAVKSYRESLADNPQKRQQKNQTRNLDPQPLQGTNFL